jgi:sporulation protein YlmC with PRC-barrel domain
VNLDDPLKLVSQLIDLPIIDKDERWCGIVDDVELEGEAGTAMCVHSLLVGPGAYSGRMPGWAFAIVRAIAGERMVHVPAAEITEIGSVVKLRCTAEELGLHRTEDKVRSWVPRRGAM